MHKLQKATGRQNLGADGSEGVNGSNQGICRVVASRRSGAPVDRGSTSCVSVSVS